jgi:hypothetical protein
MAGRRNHSKHEPRQTAGLPESVEAQLSSVVEQDGLTINTPRGSKLRMVREKKPKTVPFLSKEVAIDDIQSLDRTAILRLAAKSVTGSRSVSVPVRKREHVRSKYVVSLQNLPLSTRDANADERVHVSSAMRRAPGGRSLGAPVQAYASVSTDLMSDDDPWGIADQFTPGTFDEAYNRVYGRFDRVRSFLHDAAFAASSFFQRVERVEHRAVEEMEEALSVVEVPRFSFARALAGFAALALVVTLPANAVALYRAVSVQKTAATDAGTQAIGDVMAAAQAGSIPDSAEALKNASSRFRQADAMLSDSSALAVGIASVLPKTYRTARALLEAGDKSSEAARLLSLGFDKVFSEPGRLDARLDTLGAYARGALTLLTDASKAAATVDPASVPQAERDKVSSLITRLDASKQAIQEFAALSDILSVMSGKNTLRKYLLVFQNQTELRPTGGFMGSFAEVTLDRGDITGIRVPPGGTYDLQGQLRVRVLPPEPLQLVSARWEFQDANWSPDFPTAAEKIRWFWDKSGQSTVDGVVAVNESFVENLLKITGPIDMPEYGKTIDASNFLLETQKAVELEYDKTANTPKKFLGDLAPKLFDRLKSLKKEQWLEVAKLLSDALETKDIQVALRNPDEEQLAERYGWNGRIKDTAGDALALIESNIAGQKTDGVIAEQATHHVQIKDDGTIEDTVTLTRTHNGKKGELFRGVRNVSYLRAYVPEGSMLVSADGFRTPDKKFFQTVNPDDVKDQAIDAIESKETSFGQGVTVSIEGSRTVFGGWMQLDPGMTQTITLKYTLPMTVSDILSKTNDAPDSASVRPSARGAFLLLETSQSGKTNRDLTTTVDYPASWNVSWSRPATPASGTDITQQRVWDRDLVTAALFTPNNGQTQ